MLILGMETLNKVLDGGKKYSEVVNDRWEIDLSTLRRVDSLDPLTEQPDPKDALDGLTFIFLRFRN